jgi:protein-L-isoaspartate(D-aspartate) O-methyltransferase
MAATQSPTPARWIATGTAVALGAAAVGTITMAFWWTAQHDSIPAEVPLGAGQLGPAARQDDDPFAAARRQMVERQLRARDITDPIVLNVMGRVAREDFAPREMRQQAYEDHPLPIGHGQTISQPYIVALMTQLAQPAPKSRALEVGVGSGYQAAILARLCREVYGVEILRPLADSARERLTALGYKNVAIRCGDGYEGWPEHAPFDVIIVTAAPDHVPPPLEEQLAPGGRLVIPVGRGYQELLLIEKRPNGTLDRRSIVPVQFVPMTGEAER